MTVYGYTNTLLVKVDENSLAFLIREKVKFGQILKETVEQLNPELKLSKQGVDDLAIPV